MCWVQNLAELQQKLYGNKKHYKT